MTAMLKALQWRMCLERFSRMASRMSVFSRLLMTCSDAYMFVTHVSLSDTTKYRHMAGLSW